MYDFLNIFQNFSTYRSSLLLLNNNHLTPKNGRQVIKKRIKITDFEAKKPTPVQSNEQIVFPSKPPLKISLEKYL